MSRNFILTLVYDFYHLFFELGICEHVDAFEDELFSFLGPDLAALFRDERRVFGNALVTVSQVALFAGDILWWLLFFIILALILTLLEQ